MAISNSNTGTAAWILEIEAGSGESPELTRWLVKILMTGIDAPGFLNAEIVPPENGAQSRWSLVHRFDSVENASFWQNSDTLSNLLDGTAKGFSITQEQKPDYAPPTNVATAIVTHVKPGKEKEYRNWVSKIHVAQTNASGYRGTFVQPPGAGGNAPWTTLLRFDCADSLDRWLESNERKELISEAEELLRCDITRLTSAFPGWFPTDPATGKSPPRHKTAMLVLLILYPLIMLMSQYAQPVRTALGTALGTFACNCLSVIIISILMMPLATRLFRFWLFPSGHSPEMQNLKGYIILVCLYTLEIFIFLF
jgi:hypothetical protein